MANVDKDVSYLSLFSKLLTHGFRQISFTSLSDGSLLGAIHHKGFVPWDDDLDIYISCPDYECFCPGLPSLSGPRALSSVRVETVSSVFRSPRL